MGYNMKSREADIMYKETKVEGVPRTVENKKWTWGHILRKIDNMDELQ